MGKYQKQLTVKSAEADPRRHLKPFSFLCETQEIANLHATSLNFGYNQLIKNHQAWVLSRIKASFIDSPLWQEEYLMSTWHKGLNGPFSIRDFVITAPGSSEAKILCTSSWLILDLDTRRMLRTDHVLGSWAEETAVKDDAIAEPCGKIAVPQTLISSGKRSVLYSDIDFNLHTNNAKYLEWALDCLDPHLLIERELDEFQLNINHETKIGDAIEFYSATLSNNDYYIEGRIDQTNIFQTLLKFKP